MNQQRRHERSRKNHHFEVGTLVDKTDPAILSFPLSVSSVENSIAGSPPARVPPMAGDSGAILCHISSLKEMLDKVNEEIEQNIQKTREIESEIVKHSEAEKHYLGKESELMKEVSAAEFELNGFNQVAAAETDLLKVAEENLEFQKVALSGTRKRLYDTMYGLELSNQIRHSALNYLRKLYHNVEYSDIKFSVCKIQTKNQSEVL